MTIHEMGDGMVWGLLMGLAISFVVGLDILVALATWVLLGGKL